jgi:hypothetical protein
MPAQRRRRRYVDADVAAVVPPQAGELIRKHGNNRDALQAAAAHIIGKDANASRH